MPKFRRALKGAFVLAVSFAACAQALAHFQQQPLVVTLDGHHYVSYGPGATYTPPLRLLQAPELRMQGCHRPGGEPLAAGEFRLVYSGSGAAVDAVSMQMSFNPMRIELETRYGDVVCDGEAPGWEHGVDRMFLGDFEWLAAI